MSKLIRLSCFFVVVMVMACFLPGCGKQDLSMLNAEKKALEGRITELESQLTGKQGLEEKVVELNGKLADKYVLENKVFELEDRLAKMAGAEAPADSCVIGINALLAVVGDSAEPAVKLAFSGPASVTAVAVLPDGMALSHWSVNGEPAAGQEQKLTVDVTCNTVIEAVLRKELKVTAVNAFLRLMDSEGTPMGNKLDEYVFETEEDKRVSVYIGSVVPANYTIDHWRINGIPHYYNKMVTGIKVFDLDAAAVYEVVLKKTLTPTPKPTSKPNSTLAPTPTPTLAITEPPVQMVSVNCTNCTFSGGGYTNANGGSVPKGTRITVTGTTDIGNPQCWEINGVTNTSYGKTFQYTVNGNTTFKYTGFN